MKTEATASLLLTVMKIVKAFPTAGYSRLPSTLERASIGEKTRKKSSAYSR